MIKLITNPLARLLFLGLALLPAPASVAEEPADFLVVVHTSNSTEVVTKIQLSKIFLKSIRHWPDGLRVRPVDQDEESPVRASFTRAIHERSVASVRVYWQRQIFAGRTVPPPALGSDQEVLEYVRHNPSAVGYISSETRLEDDVKILKIVPPAPD